MLRRFKTVNIIVALIVLVAVGVWLLRDEIQRYVFKPTPTKLEEGVQAPAETEVVANKLDIPWEIAFLPDGDLLVTERPGTLRRIGEDGQVFTIEGVEHAGEGGLMGLALHPDFADNRQLYLYLTSRSDSGLINRVERYRLESDSLSNKTTIINNIPGANFHDGGRIAFGPNGKLYITTGDAGDPRSAQDKESLAGKILRLNPDGSIPDDNPFGSPVYSYGHRNPQGLAWDGQDRLWATEHGPSGTESGFDELNLITRGANYGWPLIRGSEQRMGMRTPVAQSGADETWAPAGLAFANGSLFFAGLRGETLYEARLSRDNQVTLVSHLRSKYGRLRAVAAGPEESLYITTSNTDGRGDEQADDDKVIRIDPAIFE